MRNTIGLFRYLLNSEMSGKNILFVVMDTARAHESLPMESADIMPNLAALADNGILYTNARANAPWTLPSHASMFTGQYTSDHQTHADAKQFNPDVNPLAVRLANAGYQTVAFSNNSWITRDFGFNTGFNEFFPPGKLVRGGVNLNEIARNHDGLRDKVSALLTKADTSDLVPSIINAAYARYLQDTYDNGALITNWRIKRWIQRHWKQTRPFFIFVNYLEPHLNYTPPRSFRKRFTPEDMGRSELKAVNQDPWKYIVNETEMSEKDFNLLQSLYSAELNYLDHRLGNLIEFIKETGLNEKTVLVVVSDHGENIGDHELLDHQYCLYDTVLHVPLVVHHPMYLEKEPVTAPVELRNLFPTLLDVAGVERPTHESIADRSLLNIAVEGPNDGTAISEYLVPQPSVKTLSEKYDSDFDLSQYDRGYKAICTRTWKYIEATDGTTELFNIEKDKHEQRNLADEHPHVVESLSAMLGDKLGPFTVEQNKETVTLSGGTKRRLEDLGYL